MIDRQHALPLAKQAKALGISRGTLYYAARPVPAADLALMRRKMNCIWNTLSRAVG
jgi:putative transposase